MADRLQLKNHAFRLCLAVGLPSSKDHTNTGFALACWCWRRAREFADQLTKRRPPRAELRARACLVVFELEAWTHRASQQRPRAAGRQPRSLPYAAPHHHLRPLALVQPVAQAHRPPASLLVELQHLHRIARIEMKNLIRPQPMHLAECPPLQQIVDRGRAVPRAPIAPHTERLRRNPFARLVHLHIPSALPRVWR